MQKNDCLSTAPDKSNANIKFNFPIDTVVHQVDSLSSGSESIYKLHQTSCWKYYLYNLCIHNYGPEFKLITVCIRAKWTFKNPWTSRYLCNIDKIKLK